MAEFHLHRLRARRQRQQLVAEADAERRHAGVDDRRDRADRVGTRLRVARTVRQEDAVGRERERGLRGGFGGHHRQAASALDQEPQDVVLDSEVVGDDVKARVAGRPESRSQRPGAGGPVVGRRAAHHLREILSRHRRRRLCPCDGMLDPCVAHGAPARMQPFCAPFSRSNRVSFRVSRSAMPTMSWSARYAPRSPAERKFDACRGRSRMTSPAANGRRDSTSSAIHADVADVRIGERDDLPRIARVRQDFLISGHRGVEDHFADRRALGADRPAAKYRAVGQGQHGRRGRGKQRGADGGSGSRGGHGDGAIGSGKRCPGVRGVRTCEAGTPASPAAVPASKHLIIPARGRRYNRAADAAGVSTPPKSRRRRRARGRSHSPPRTRRGTPPHRQSRGDRPIVRPACGARPRPRTPRPR